MSLKSAVRSPLRLLYSRLYSTVPEFRTDHFSATSLFLLTLKLSSSSCPTIPIHHVNRSVFWCNERERSKPETGEWFWLNLGHVRKVLIEIICSLSSHPFKVIIISLGKKRICDLMVSLSPSTLVLQIASHIMKCNDLPSWATSTHINASTFAQNLY